MKYRFLPAALAAIVFSSAVAQAAEAQVGAGGHDEAILIAEIALFLLIGRGLGEIMRRLGQPEVMGALIAGLILGPSLLGWAWPAASKLLFPQDAATKNLITGIANIGVLMLLLLTGMEIDLKLARKVGTPAVAVAGLGVAVPFACGFLLGEFLPDSLLPDPAQRLVASLFLGTALSISSIKIVAMVVRDLNFMRRNLGQIIVASAILEDTAGWIIVSLMLGVVGTGVASISGVIWTLLGTILFLGLSYIVGRPLVFRLLRLVNDHSANEYMVITATLLVMLVMALITHLIGVNTVLGAFVAGVLVGESPILSGEIEERLRGFITAFLMPIFFGVSGIGADLTVLRDPALLWLTGGLVLTASAGKFSGAFLGGRLGRLSWREALAVGCAMNARGGTEVIVASIGLSMGVLSRNVYTMIVSMAVLTTMVMPFSLRWALARLPVGEAEADRLRKEAIDAAGFVSQFERVLVAADNSANGIFATKLAGFLAGQRGHPMTVLTLDPADLGRSNGSARQLTETAKESARASAGTTEAGKERPRGDAIDVIARVAVEDASEAAAEEAKKGFDLLFVGLGTMTDGNGDFTDRVNELAAGFDGPVALVIGAGDTRREHRQPSRMLIPVNGTEASRRGAELAFAIVSPEDTRCAAVHVAETQGHTGAEQAVLDDIVELGDRHGFDVTPRLYRDTEPGKAILRETAADPADFLVMGVNRRVGEALVLGKTATGLLKCWNASLVLLVNR